MEAHLVYTEGVVGSNPTPPIVLCLDKGGKVKQNYCLGKSYIHLDAIIGLWPNSGFAGDCIQILHRPCLYTFIIWKI